MALEEFNTLTVEEFNTLTAGLRKGTHVMNITKEIVFALPGERIYTSTSTGQKKWTRITSHQREVIQLLSKLGLEQNVHFITGNSAPMNGKLGIYIEKLQPMSNKETLKEQMKINLTPEGKTTPENEFEILKKLNPEWKKATLLTQHEERTTPGYFWIRISGIGIKTYSRSFDSVLFNVCLMPSYNTKTKKIVKHTEIGFRINDEKLYNPETN